MRCKRDKNGEMNWNQMVQEGSVEGRQTPGTRYRERAEERGQLVLRQPKLSVVVVNITYEGKNNHKLIEDDHWAKIILGGKLRNPYFCHIFGMERPIFVLKIAMY